MRDYHLTDPRELGYPEVPWLIGDRMQFDRPKRRDFMTLVGGAAVAWPLAARAQQPERMRQIAVLMALPEADPAAKELLSEFTQGLAELGWTAGGKMRMDVRWASDNVDLMRKFAMELVALEPNVILANSTAVTAALQRETQTIPIVFAIVGDPVGSGFVASLPRRIPSATLDRRSGHSSRCTGVHYVLHAIMVVSVCGSDGENYERMRLDPWSF